MNNENFQQLLTRIPKNFIPKQYTINLYLNIRRLEYFINVEVEIISKSRNEKYLILNFLQKCNKIKELSLKKFDRISDEWKEISNTYLFDISEQNLKVEDGIYIPLNTSVLEDDELTLNCQIEGSLEKNRNGFCFCFLDDTYSSLLNDRATFMKKWNEYSEKSIKDNPMIADIKFFCLCEPNFLREIFPCFDEPCFKAIFNFALQLDKEYVDSNEKLKCISNGSLVSVEEELEKYKFIFSSSPLMSCYLFTFVIGNYDFIESVNDNNKLIRVFTPVNHQTDGLLAMTLATNSIKFYENFFGIPYTMNKLDLICVKNINFRALENWGCIVFLNCAMLYSHFQSILEKKFASRTICHEISHMWFGNLVTMEWWNDIWLNEGFARILEFLCLNSIDDKGNNYWENFIEYIYEKALISDEKKNTHPVVIEIKSVKDISTIFDDISYSKGSSIIRMLYYYIGEEEFKQSLKEYLLKYQFKCTNTSLLWECFSQVTKLDISSLMNSWVKNPFHPLIIATIKEVNNKMILHVSQEPLQKSNINKNETIWKIPLFIKTKKNNSVIVFDTKEIEFDIEEKFKITKEDIEKKNDFIILNNDIKGFYRVDYSEQMLDLIFEDYKKGKTLITQYDIFGILSYYSSQMEYNYCFYILKRIKPIENYLVLNFAKDLYLKLLCENYHEIGFENILYSVDKANEYKSNFENFKSFFMSLVQSPNNGKLKSISEKMYIYNENNCEYYRNQFNDEFENLYLNFVFLLDKRDSIFQKIIQNFDKFYQYVHKNFKYTIYEIVIYFSKQFCPEKELINYKRIINDYLINFSINSCKINEINILSFSNFDNSSYQVFEIFFSMLKNKRNEKYTNLNIGKMEYSENKIRILDYIFEYLKNKFLTQNEISTFGEYFSSENKNDDLYVGSFIAKLITRRLSKEKTEKIINHCLLSYFNELGVEKHSYLYEKVTIALQNFFNFNKKINSE